MQKIIPHLWFDKEAKEAAEFYTTTFPNSSITSSTVLHNTPSGDCDILSFNLMGLEFMAISAGPVFKLNPSISFMVNFDPSKDPEAKTKLEELWNKLSENGKVLMALDKYPFSKLYGWVQDKFGVTWQLIFTNPEGEPRPAIIPSLLFTKDAYGKAEEASEYYISTFKNSKRGTLAHYPAGMEPNKEGTVMFTDFMLENQWFTAMDGGGQHEFQFNEAISLLVSCDSQEEIDGLWEKLSAVPQAEQCGWLKDQFGVSWQVTSSELHKILRNGTPEIVDKVTKVFLNMKKIEIVEIKKAI